VQFSQLNRPFELVYNAALVSVVTCSVHGLIQGSELLVAVGTFGLVAIEVTLLTNPNMMR